MPGMGPLPAVKRAARRSTRPRRSAAMSRPVQTWQLPPALRPVQQPCPLQARHRRLLGSCLGLSCSRQSQQLLLCSPWSLQGLMYRQQARQRLTCSHMSQQRLLPFCLCSPAGAEGVEGMLEAQLCQVSCERKLPATAPAHAIPDSKLCCRFKRCSFCCHQHCSCCPRAEPSCPTARAPEQHRVKTASSYSTAGGAWPLHFSSLAIALNSDSRAGCCERA